MREEKKILSEGEIKSLKDEKVELENTLRQVEGENYGAGGRRSVDTQKIKKHISRLDKEIYLGTVGKKVKGIDKDRVAKAKRDLGEQLREGMPSRDEMDRPHLHPGAIQKHMEWQKRNARKIQAWKQLNRRLGERSNIERLRRR